MLIVILALWIGFFIGWQFRLGTRTAWPTMVNICQINLNIGFSFTVVDIPTSHLCTVGCTIIRHPTLIAKARSWHSHSELIGTVGCLNN